MIWALIGMWAIGMLTGFCIGFRRGAVWERKQMFPNTWRCPVEGCDGEGGSNNPAALIHLIGIHNDAKHRPPT